MSKELVPLCLFDKAVSFKEKDVISEKLQRFVPCHSAPTRYGTGYDKPYFGEEISFGTTLADLVGKNSAFFFKALDISPDFLTEPSVDWLSLPSYKEGLEKIKTLAVVNDASERAVKLTDEFLTAAKIESRYQATLHVVSENRKELPNLRASKSSISEWCSSPSSPN